MAKFALDLIVTSQSAASGVGTGALQVAGGGSISGALYVGGDLNGSGALNGAANSVIKKVRCLFSCEC